MSKFISRNEVLEVIVEFVKEHEEDIKDIVYNNAYCPEPEPDQIEQCDISFEYLLSKMMKGL